MKPRIDNDRILEAALQSFGAYGYRKTTLEDVAQQLGIQPASLYAYCTSKRDLYEQTVRYAMLRWQNRVKEAVSACDDPRAQLVTLCRTALNHLAGDPSFCALLKNDPAIFPMFPAVDPCEEINAESVDMIRRILTAGAAQGRFRALDAQATAELLFAIYKGFILHAYVQGEERTLETWLPAALELILNGICQKES